MGTSSIAYLLILLLVFGIPVGIFIWAKRITDKAEYQPLILISPVLNLLVVMALVGKPILEHLRQHQSLSDSIPPVLLVPLLIFFLVCIYASVGATTYFFYRAMRNINFLSQARLLTPLAALLMVVPLANMIAMPYIWGRTYYFSRKLHQLHKVGKLTAAIVSVGAFALILTGLATGIMTGNPAMWVAGYDGLSLSVISLTTSSAGAALLTHIVQRISTVQELYAERQGLVPPRDRRDESISAGMMDLLRSTALAACVGLALFTAVWPWVVSNVVENLRVTLFGQVARLQEQVRPTRAQILQDAAKEVSKMVPQQIDQITRLDGARVEANQFVYEYSLNVDRLTGEALSNLYRHVRTNAVPAYCTGHLKVFRDISVAVIYRYRYLDGGQIGQVAIDERDCH